MENKPLILSHRGRGDHNLPENTIEACELAIEQGADALEVDVRFCASGELVIFHDLFFKRMIGKKGSIWSTSLTDLKQFNLNKNAGPAIRIPTLKEFINHFKGTVPINLDAKVFTPVAGQFAKYIVRAIKGSGNRSQFWVSSFNPVFLRTVKYCSWDIRTGYLFEHFDMLRRFTEPFWYVDYWHPEINIVNEHFLKLAAAKEKNIYVWANDEKDMSHALSINLVKGIITDYPQVLSKKNGQNPNN
ncbi:MAG: glycerophosphodiester phosphodiesterase [Calditrichaeota bacterium]|nr:glycerophosphodiester phosphodiesterase [Calditrichota bacterium]